MGDLETLQLSLHGVEHHLSCYFCFKQNQVRTGGSRSCLASGSRVQSTTRWEKEIEWGFLFFLFYFVKNQPCYSNTN